MEKTELQWRDEDENENGKQDLRDRSAPFGIFFLLSPLLVHGFCGVELELLEGELVTCMVENVSGGGEKEEKGDRGNDELVEIFFLFN